MVYYYSPVVLFAIQSLFILDIFVISIYCSKICNEMKNKTISQSIQLKNIIEKQNHITVNTVTKSNRKTKTYHSQYSYKI